MLMTVIGIIFSAFTLFLAVYTAILFTRPPWLINSFEKKITDWKRKPDHKAYFTRQGWYHLCITVWTGLSALAFIFLVPVLIWVGIGVFAAGSYVQYRIMRRNSWLPGQNLN